MIKGNMHRSYDNLIDIQCSLIGCIVFVLIYGVKIINPTFISWTLRGDAATHFLGWNSFRFDPWGFPLGAIKSYLYPQGTSVVFTDSIPLAAIILKLFSSLLPKNFQYHGIWILLNYLLQGFFGAKLLRQTVDKTFLIIIGVLFLLLSPIMAFKTAQQEALSSHWLILASLYLYLSPPKAIKTRFNTWIFLIVISSLIHFYLLSMVVSVWIAYLFRMSLDGFSKLTLLLTSIKTSIITLIVMWVAGYFVIGLGASYSPGFGSCSMNILSPFFPDSAFPFTFFKPITLANKMQHGGFNYFGAGVVLMLMISAYELASRKFLFNKSKYIPLIVMSILLYVFSISNVITFANNVVANIILPSSIERIFGIWHASGRMFWPIYYLIVVLSYGIICKQNTTSVSIFIVTILLIIQIVDLRLWYSSIKIQNDLNLFTSPLSSPKWEKITEKITHMEIIPPDRDGDYYVPFALIASQLKKTINVGYVARIDNNTSKLDNKQIDNFTHGIYKENTLYIVKNYNLLNNQTVAEHEEEHIEMIDGYITMTVSR